jgi:hypothetical protein
MINFIKYLLLIKQIGVLGFNKMFDLKIIYYLVLNMENTQSSWPYSSVAEYTN